MCSRIAPVLIAGLMLAVAAPVGAADHISVTGTGRHLGADFPYPSIQVHISAFADATGLDPRGKLSVDVENGHSYTGQVTCLNVLGSQATIGIRIVNSSDPALVGQGELWSVVDSSSFGSPDQIAGYEITPAPPVLCPILVFNVPIVSGNYVIHGVGS
jgi:hypothetical protein